MLYIFSFLVILCFLSYLGVHWVIFQNYQNGFHILVLISNLYWVSVFSVNLINVMDSHSKMLLIRMFLSFLYHVNKRG